MRILLVAFACGPGQGSEPGVGWKTARLLSRHHRVVVLTSPRHQEAIEKMWAAKEKFENAEFVFLGRSPPYHPNRMLARWQNWLEYFRWLRLASRETPRLCRDFQIDLVHHLTITTWRLPPVQVLSGTPLLWGPLGGAAHYPWHLLGGMSLGGAVFELLRNTANQILIHQPFLKEACRRSSAILGSSQESVDWIKKLGGQSTPVTKLNAMFFPEGKLEEFQALLARRRMDAPLRAFAGGNLIGSKGVGFALRALKLAKERGVVIPYTVASFGPEKSFLEALAERLGIRDQVVFHPGFTGTEYSKALLEHSIYLLPSFREGSPITILEAMLAGQVPVVVKASTQGEIVDARCGFAVEVGSAEKICSGLADALVAVAADASRRRALAQAAHEKVAREYRESSFLEKLNDAYRSATSRRSVAALKRNTKK
jgi:glycosyltransferase involved in cell wall biosynthesis